MFALVLWVQHSLLGLRSLRRRRTLCTRCEAAPGRWRALSAAQRECGCPRDYKVSPSSMLTKSVEIYTMRLVSLRNPRLGTQQTLNTPLSPRVAVHHASASL